MGEFDYAVPPELNSGFCEMKVVLHDRTAFGVVNALNSGEGLLRFPPGRGAVFFTTIYLEKWHHKTLPTVF